MEDNAVRELIKTHPGLTTAQIASRLDVTREALLKILYEDLKGQVAADRSYGWWPADQVPTLTADDTEAPDTIGGQTPLLHRLLQYYLDCIKRDRPHEVSFPLPNEGADYVPLPVLPLSPVSWENLPTDPVRTAIETTPDVVQGRKLLHVGYPIRIEPDGAGQGLRVEPLFVFLVEDDGAGGWSVAEDAFSINSMILRNDEAANLLDQLGLGGVDAQPPWDEVFRRLQSLCEEWAWRENLNIHAINNGQALRAIQQDGYYNRAILYAASPPPYTNGLESELRWLQGRPVNSFNGTALKSWVDGQTDEGNADKSPLLEIIPLNEEQREAVQSGMTAPLTVITGPPGTGKSQVVASLIINAVYRGQRVLFACRNNKPVKVVAGRVNGLGPVPLLQQVGRPEDNPLLRQFVDNLLVAARDPEQEQQERFFLDRINRLRSDMSKLHAAVDATVAARNAVVQAQQTAEQWRATFSRQWGEALQAFDLKAWEAALSAVDLAIQNATKAKQSFFARLFWGSHVAERLEILRVALQKIDRLAESVGLALITDQPTEANLVAVAEGLRRLRGYTPIMQQAKQYFAAVSKLSQMRRVEDLAADEIQLLAQVMETSQQLWACWLRLRPQRLSAEEREHLHEFSAQLALLDGNNAQWRSYFRAYERVASVLPCAWGITALRARSLPCQPGLFDLLIMDEAAAGDIASAVPLLYRCRRAVVIGDKNQMSHITQLSAAQDRMLRSNLDLDGPGCAKWSFAANSVFALAAALVPTTRIFNLKDHHRSHRHIIEFSNRHFYGGALRVVTRYDKLRGLPRGEPAVKWVNVRGHVVRPASGGAFNRQEADKVVEVCNSLDANCSIGVVTPFAMQKMHLKELLRDKPDVLVDTANGFQGDERDIMVFSPVVSDGMSRTGLGFLRSQFNLFNVAVTRARSRLIIVGDQDAARNCGVQYLAALADYVADLRPENDEPEATDFGPRYPNDKRAEARPSEIALYEALYAKGMRPTPRLGLEQYRIQLALRDERPDAQRIDVEIDDLPDGLWTREHLRRLVLRDRRLKELGWQVMRFYAHEVEFDLAGCVRRLQAAWGAA
jgi:hypothetical protein